jgi:ankyrin repeat protein
MSRAADAFIEALYRAPSDSIAVAAVRAFEGDVNAQHSSTCGAWGTRQTALTVTAQVGHCGAIEELARRGADPHVATADDYSPLCMAARVRNCSLATLLRMFPSVDVDVARTHDGYTALHRAAANGAADNVVTLLAADARVGVRDSAGKTPEDWARERGFGAIAEVLASSGSRCVD